MGTIGLGSVQVRGLSLVPSPPAMITAFTGACPPLNEFVSQLVTIGKLLMLVGLQLDLLIALYGLFGYLVPIELFFQILGRPGIEVAC